MPRPMSKNDIHTFFTRLAGNDPEPKGELDHVNVYTLLVAVVLSAQATDIGVNKATGPLFKVVDSPEKMVALGEAKLRHYIRTIGLFNAKAKNVIALSQQLIEKFDSIVPDDRELLEGLPGVGRKTANVVLNTAFGHMAMAVDTHIYRVSNRTGIAPGKNVLEVENRLMRLVPKEFLLDAHHWLILHGRYTCTARKPKCGACIIEDLCEFKQKRDYL